MIFKLGMGSVALAAALVFGQAAGAASVGATAGDGNCNSITVTVDGEAYTNCFYDDGQDEPDNMNPAIIPGANISLLENLNGVTMAESTDGNTVDPVFGDLGEFVIVGKNDGAGNNDGTVDLGGNSGSFGIDLSDAFDYFIVSLKASNGYYAFLFDDVDAGIIAGTFSGLGNGLSHITYAGVVCVPDDSQDISCLPPVDIDVPVPAGLPLILSGLGVMGILRARSRKSA